MTYRIRGLDPAQFAAHLAMNAGELAEALSQRVTAGEAGRYPCRVTLEDARPGEQLLLTHFTNHAVDTPYRNAFAIYVRAGASAAAEFVDDLPPVLRGRPIALRGYTSDGALHHAALALADDVDAGVRKLLEDSAIAYIDAHNAMHGCFAARIERYDGA